jgi:hypothetical protein
MYKKLIGIVSAMALSTIPVMASAAPVANPASSLSVAKARAGTPTTGKNKLGGGGAVLAALIAAGVVAIVAIAATKDDNSDSN